MFFNCPECKIVSFYPPGFVAAHFACYTSLSCLVCQYVMEFPKAECLNYTLMCWRN